MTRVTLGSLLALLSGALVAGQTLTASITPKAATVTCTTPAKVYDGTTSAPGTTCVLGGILPGDVVSITWGAATFASKQVGTAKTVTIPSIVKSGADAGNYTIPTSATAVADITKKSLTVSGVTVANKTYDATTLAVVNAAAAVLTGLIAGDVCALDPASMTASFADKNVGTNKPVTLSGTAGVIGVDCANYTLGPAPPPPPSPSGVFSASDFTYLGVLRMPSSTTTDWAAPGLTGRMVGAVVHLFVYDVGGAHVYELAEPGTYGANWQTAPTMTLVADWGDVHHGKNVSYTSTGSPRAFDAYTPGGMYWHEGLQRLYWTYYDAYNIPGYPDWNLGFSTLDNVSTRTSTAYGPFRTTATTTQGQQVGSFNCMYPWMNPIDGTMMCGATLQSGDTHVPYGPSAFSGLAWPGPSTPSGFSAANLNFPDRELMYYSMAGKIGANGSAGTNPITSLRRPYKPYIFDAFAGDTSFPQVNPALYGGVGSWTQRDYFRGATWIEGATKRGVLAMAAVAGATSQNPTDCLAAHEWYSNGGIGHLNCPHGCPQQGNSTGPTYTAYLPLIYVFDPADLLAVKAGTKVDYTVNPTATVDLLTFGAKFAEPGFGYESVSGFFYDASKKHLFVAAQGADTNGHTSPWTLIHVFAVHD